MSKQTLAICLLVVGTFSQLALCQEVNSRSANPDEPRINADPDLSSSGIGGHPRTIYSQKLSGHRMMHFGKRPLVPVPPSFVTGTQMLGLYSSNGEPQVAASQPVEGRQTMQPQTYSIVYAPTFSEEELREASRKQHLMEIVSNLLDQNRRKDCDEEPDLKQKRLNQAPAKASAQQVLGPFELLRLAQINAVKSRAFNNPIAKQKRLLDDESDDIIDLDRHLENQAKVFGRSQNLIDNERQPSEEQVADQKPSQDVGNISVASRSVPFRMGAGSEMPSLTRAQISHILWGRQIPETRGNSLLSLDNFIKKAEPQKMTFMHFG